MHHQAVKHILCYVKETTSYGLKYQRGWGPEELVGLSQPIFRGFENQIKTKETKAKNIKLKGK